MILQDLTPELLDPGVATLRRDDRLAQFNMQQFTGDAGESLRFNKYFIDRNIPR